MDLFNPNQTDVPKRRMTFPSMSRSSQHRRIFVTPPPLAPEMDEGFHENHSTLRTGDHFAYMGMASDSSNVFSPEKQKASDMVEVKKILHGDLWNKPPLSRDRKLAAALEDSFYVSMRPLLYIFQVFGILPVRGFAGTHPTQLRFSWKQWQMISFVFNFSGVSFLFIVYSLDCLTRGFTYNRSVNLVFYGYSIIALLLFLNLARNWAKLNSFYSATDVILIDYGYPRGLRKKFLICTISIATLAFVEHALSKADNLLKTLNCFDLLNDTLYAYLKNQYTQVFKLVGYSPIIGLYAFITNFTAAVCWNLTDLFLGLIAMSLSSRLIQINQRVLATQGQERSSSFWRKTREEYNAVSVLTKQVDSYVQRIMLLCLGNNLFFICLQLLRSLQPRSTVYEALYFFWSFGLLIIRTAFVTLCAAGVHDESSESKTALYSVPHESFCCEVKRFLTQLTTDELVLTGCRFFAVTRGLILTIAGTVVTYEIVLVQFKTEPDAVDAVNVTTCSSFIKP